jgi:hypothetical protein
MQSWKTDWKQGGPALAITKSMMNKVQFYAFYILTAFSLKLSFHLTMPVSDSQVGKFRRFTN